MFTYLSTMFTYLLTYHAKTEETVSYSHNNNAKEVGLEDPASAKQLVYFPKCSFHRSNC